MLNPMRTEPERRRFTVDEYDQMVEAGILTKYDHVELIEGEILEMSPIGSRHLAGTDRANALFTPRLQGRAIVRIGGSFRLSDYSKPQPDLILLKYRKDYYESSDAGVKDALLVIEVSDSSIRYDRGPKLLLYARYGVREVWIEDLTTDTLLVFRNRRGERYATQLDLKTGDSVSPLAFRDIEVAVADLLGVPTRIRRKKH
jgi:Uma2 family endonuclease